MTLTNDDLKTILNRIASPRCSIVAACAGVCGVASFYRLGSRQVVGWPDEDDPPMAFGDALKAARKIQALSYESAIREACHLGTVRYHDGRPVYELDERIVMAGDADADKETLMLLWGQPHPYLVQDGHLVPVRDMVPAALTTKMLTSLLPGQYAETQTTNINVVDSGGVLRLGLKKPAEPSPCLAAAVEPPSPPIDAEFTTIEPTGDESPVDDTPLAEPQGTPLRDMPEPQPDISEPRPGDSPLVAALRQKLREGPRNPRPSHAVHGTVPDDAVRDDMPDHAVRPPRDGDGERRTKMC
jgi:hypothetical protein